MTSLCFVQEKADLGELLLSLNFLPTAGRLNVDIIKAKQLLQTDLVGGSGTCPGGGHNGSETQLSIEVFLLRSAR